jgi:hypothetical protein
MREQKAAHKHRAVSQSSAKSSLPKQKKAAFLGVAFG